MLPGLDLLEINLRGLSHAELIVKVNTIIEMSRKHPGLQNISPDVPGPDLLEKINVDYAASVQAAANGGGRRANEERDEKRLEVLEHAMMWGQHVVILSKTRKDPSLLQDNGFDQKKQQGRQSKSKNGPTPVPEARVKHGDTGELILIVKQIVGRGTYEVRYTTTPNDPESFTDGGHHTLCQIALKGFVPGTKYFFSLRYHGPNGTSAWSDPISIIAL
ncbi:hypothetical protein GMST_02000 [Geomonas silvestris]|uniref:Fibronectin type-III domain-containing protein n=1 Tax=Geomonas silvestris TaxID=2740184 RepID=A0A6V8MD12_9BACT|nr:fibronectin type III domain-containing protein [Geomonas silvestris]GFO57875.1 hypothetical protein GMST_02000 [Geomonas silvestris]